MTAAIPAPVRAPVPAAHLALALALPALLTLAISILYRPFPIDDAYITFRYAANLAAGRGLVFNAGERVLGTSTPLFALILAAFNRAGADIPTAALWLGILATVGLVAVVQLLAVRSLSLRTVALLGLWLAAHPLLPFTANSGMETSLYLAAVYGSILLALQERPLSAGAAAGLAVLFRPDGGLVALLVVAILATRRRRVPWRTLAAIAVVALPWIVFAAAYYGSPLPNSIAAKQVIHPASATRILAYTLGSLNHGVAEIILFLLALVGMMAAARERSELCYIVVWMALYLLGLAAAGIDIYYVWYVTPLAPGVLLLAARGLDRVEALVRWPGTGGRRWRPAVALLLALALFGLLVRDIGRNRFMLGVMGYNRAVDYLELAKILQPRLRPGDVVMVGEVGALSYGLPDQVIIDGAGINTPRMMVLRREDRENLESRGLKVPPEGTADWVVRGINEFRPRYIVTYKIWYHLDEIMQDPTIARAYQRVDLKRLTLRDYVVLERRAAP